ncbi:MAG: class I SAM-dependent methyltransferase [Phycisphaerae bacterium]
MRPRRKSGRGGGGGFRPGSPGRGARPVGRPSPPAPDADGPRHGPATDWGAVADWYDELVGEAGSEYHREVVVPGVLRLLGLSAGQECLDVACGQGVLCRILHRQGVRATGVDAAAELIRLARRHGEADIDYRVGDARDLSFLPAGRYDAAACVLAIQNIHPILPVFQSVQRVLKPGGRFVCAMMHPCFRGPKATSWGWDEGRQIRYRRVDRYLIPRKEPIVTHPGSAPHQYTWSFHKPIGAYVKALRQAGLLVDALEEWPSHKTTPPGPRAAAENAARKEIPLFLALRAVKVAPPPAAEQPPELQA